jgi:hypothetical protein
LASLSTLESDEMTMESSPAPLLLIVLPRLCAKGCGLVC